MRRVLLVVALVACKSKSEPAERSRPTIEAPGGPQAGSGSAVVDEHAGSGSANIATPVTPTDTGIQPLKGSEPRRKDKPVADPAPAVPTPAKPDDGVKPAVAASGEAPADAGLTADLGKVPSGIQGPGGRDVGARLPPGSVGFAGIQSSALTTQSVADASAKIKTAYRPGLERCYRVYLQAHPNATGKATMMLTLAPTGIPTPAVTAFADEVTACLTKMAAQWRFQLPPDPGPVGNAPMRLTIELTFNPG
jgi:hypothetical protein